MTIKTALLSFIFALTLLGSQTIQVVHDAVHPFHAHLVEDPSEREKKGHQHLHASHHGDHHSIEPWLCDLLDGFSHTNAFIASLLSLSFSKNIQPGLVGDDATEVSIRVHLGFWSRAPPVCAMF
ncbi:hypothetical protein P8S54_04005 [Thiomicrospira sp. R3]|uniref:hypothetical protein n=1 Tax=Thiomicrospira sp. R3 TaxID=3035472 RepID=UPI00259BE5A3|nr:hypothetical protein [Thiomicrospira sp. R3]WFE69470.1 hypothetical protein P8S54_04005 [Thiomicrospira sp. R3]